MYANLYIMIIHTGIFAMSVGKFSNACIKLGIRFAMFVAVSGTEDSSGFRPSISITFSRASIHRKQKKTHSNSDRL